MMSCAPAIGTSASAAVISMDAVFKRNEAFRSSAGVWHDDAAINASAFGFGWPNFRRGRWVASMMALPVGPHPIQHDLTTWLGASIEEQTGKPIRYLEMGVALLKCFDTQAHYFHGAKLVAMDIEDPNPARASTWGAPAVLQTWRNSKLRRMRGKPLSYVKHWPAAAAPNGNDLYYIAGNMYGGSHIWNTLKNVTEMNLKSDFNLILSDAAHTPVSVSVEIDYLIRHDLFGGPRSAHFAMVWDDCKGPIADVVSQRVAEMRKHWAKRHATTPLCFVDKPFEIGSHSGVNIPGAPSVTCLLTSLDLSPLFGGDRRAGGLAGSKCRPSP